MISRNEIYLKFGQTAEAAQLFETSLGTLLLGMKAIENGWGDLPNTKEAAEFLRSLQKDPLGRLLGRLKSFGDIHDDLIAILTTALKSRNTLTHGFFERYKIAIESNEGRSKMIFELEELHNKIFEARQITDAISSTVLNVIQGKRR